MLVNSVFVGGGERGSATWVDLVTRDGSIEIFFSHGRDDEEEMVIL